MRSSGACGGAGPRRRGRNGSNEAPIPCPESATPPAPSPPAPPFPVPCRANANAPARRRGRSVIAPTTVDPARAGPPGACRSARHALAGFRPRQPSAIPARIGRGGAGLSYDTFREDVGGVYSMRPMPLVTPPRITPPPVTPPPGPAPAPPPVPVAQDITGEVGVTCAKLELSSTGDRRTVRGFVGSPEDLEKVRTSKVAQGAAIEVAVRKWPQCEVLLTLDPWLVGGGELAVSIAEGAPERRAGEAMPIKVVTPAWPSYVNVAYIQADGSVLHLVQTDPANLRTLSPRRDLAFGDGAEGRSTFRASAPFGAEMAVVIASSSPLFADARPRKETERDFLTALRRALLWRPDPDAPARRIVAGVAAVITREK